ncbi:Hypothetical predicted protein [Octopus vulgaris]|uniref:C-type lectin domain-containing protein n=1 Tax=Octopus vulgaris TaxID=6645 RepID=A0AA36AHD8_OCTVU|nr:Hypothetical predicted protein [Octopus vulgaris]
MLCFSVSHDIHKANLYVIFTFSMLLFQICLGSNVAFREYYGTRVAPPLTAIPEDDKLIQISNIRSEVECFSHCVTYSECGMIIYSVSNEVCIVRKIKQLPGASSFIDIPANSIYTMLQAQTVACYCGTRYKCKALIIYLCDILPKAFCPESDAYCHFHIGLCKDLTKNIFVWQNGEAKTFDFWSEGNPSNSGDNENSVGLIPYYSYRWNDVPCKKLGTGRQICEIVV